MSADAMPSEMPRWISVRQCEGQQVAITADDSERAGLADRFGLVSVNALTAHVSLSRKGAIVSGEGDLIAEIVQSCAVSGDDLPVRIETPLQFLFVPAGSDLPEEIELDADDCDEIPYDGDRFDLGEAVAQSLLLAIDPFATGPDADAVRKEVGLDEPERENPFSVLRGLGKGGKP